MEKTALVTAATGNLGREVAKAVTARSTISPAHPRLGAPVPPGRLAFLTAISKPRHPIITTMASVDVIQ